jgi:hypothetical protein
MSVAPDSSNATHENAKHLVAPTTLPGMKAEAISKPILLPAGYRWTRVIPKPTSSAINAGLRHLYLRARCGKRAIYVYADGFFMLTINMPT